MSVRAVDPPLPLPVSPPPTSGAPRDEEPAGEAGHQLTTAEYFVEPSARILMARDPLNPRCETIRALRTELLMRRGSAQGRADIVALVSPCAGEGRSLLAADLAIAFAQTGRPTLLVDADMRHPQQHVLFPVPNRKGLSQAIELGRTPQLYTVRDLPQLSVLMSGAMQRNPLELLSSQRFATMIEEWRRLYAFVVLDTSPLSKFSDGLAVASMVGRVLTLSRARHTPLRDMQDMLRRLAATRAEILGAVINHF
jgi:protein-tyrosine kinase